MKMLELSPKQLLPVLIIVSLILDFSDGAVSGVACGEIIRYLLKTMNAFYHLKYCSKCIILPIKLIFSKYSLLSRRLIFVFSGMP